METISIGAKREATTGDPIVGTWSGAALTMPNLSKWQCGLFGNDPRKSNGLVWRPVEGQEPNWFWRKMQYLAFGNRWVKDGE